ncbi:hypothetical protein GCM10022223_16650 [Kineosporia mesophila]|uniref:Uncharacterized protein n=1 Tax=Kineosporia mesophila TaxID=566012 RepID=A0ABP6ZBC4_9ACTN|nr:hypothetical protein [Kineosporia mesophila]MCD5352097.1 hypothetical protein [Kineosporia mesophila]
MTNTSATPGRVQLRGIDFAYRSQGGQELGPVVLDAHGLTSSMRGALGDPAHPIESAQRPARTLPDAELVVTETYDEMLRWGERIATFLA